MNGGVRIYPLKNNGQIEPFEKYGDLEAKQEKKGKRKGGQRKGEKVAELMKEYTEALEQEEKVYKEKLEEIHLKKNADLVKLEQLKEAIRVEKPIMRDEYEKPKIIRTAFDNPVIKKKRPEIIEIQEET